MKRRPTTRNYCHNSKSLERDTNTQIFRRPEDFDVVVASNLFGDILTDIGAIITGSMGLAPSGNINPTRKFPSMFEPVHGSAPDISGKEISNPMASILSLEMMLDHLGEKDAAKDIQKALLKVLENPETLTPDLGGKYLSLIHI